MERSMLIHGVALLDAEGQRLAVKYMQSTSSSRNVRGRGVGTTTTSSSNVKKGGSSSSSSSGGGGGVGRYITAMAAGTGAAGVAGDVAAGTSSLSGGGGGAAGGGATTKTDSTSTSSDYSAQKNLEQQMLSRFIKIVGRTEVEAFEVEKYVVLGRSLNDVFLFLVGDQQGCNEIFFLEVFNCLTSVLTSVTGGQINKKNVLDNLDLVFLMFDEMFDNGDEDHLAEKMAFMRKYGERLLSEMFVRLLLEHEPSVVLARLQMQDGIEIEAATSSSSSSSNSNSGTAAGGAGDVLGTQTAFNQAISSAKENLIRSLLSGGS